MNFVKTLSRDEMKNVMAGSNENCPDGNGGCITCFTPDGEECWYRCDNEGDANQICQSIYPAHGDQVFGFHSVCDSSCTYNSN